MIDQNGVEAHYEAQMLSNDITEDPLNGSTLKSVLWGFDDDDLNGGTPEGWI